VKVNKTLENLPGPASQNVLIHNLDPFSVPCMYKQTCLSACMHRLNCGKEIIDPKQLRETKGYMRKVLLTA